MTHRSTPTPRSVSHRNLGRTTALVLMAGLLAGCAATHRLPDPELPSAPIELTTTPFHPQESYQCGPAALATVLQTAGVDVSPEALVEQVWLPERRGSLQIELVAATRRHGRVAYTIVPEFEALIAELEAGRPVLVMQNLGLNLIPLWHFAVVIGFEPENKTVLLRSGTTERETMRLNRFLRSWQRAEYWAMVALEPGQLPATPDRRRYLSAVADLEHRGATHAAARSYQAWLDQHPDDPIALFGNANSLAAAGDNDGAEAVLRHLLAQRPDDAAAMNNLAQVMLRRGCPDAAVEVLETARAQPGLSPRLASALESSLAAALASEPDPEADCGAGIRGDGRRAAR